ncbi:hypothetical protein BGZ73_004855 [Actinomortierella ambigua]|nr:hypothetical protein BGZ73_004855 [Actinomortierella ambigua]
MKLDFLSKVLTAYFAPATQLLSNGHGVPSELAPVKSVAIIGAGAAGASTAYYLEKYLHESYVPKHLQYNHAITIYELNERIGGRCAVYRVPGHTDKVVEAGASIFVKVNRNLMDATKAFNLKLRKLDDENMAIWDGQQFVYQDHPSRLWNIARALWRWGYAPFKVRGVVSKAVNNLLASYKTTEPFESVQTFASRFNLDKLAAVHSDQLLRDHGVHDLFGREIFEVASRVNYGSNLDEIHGLGGLVSMAAEGAYQVVGGNFQIFEGMIANSHANVKLGTKIARIIRVREGEETKFEVTTTTGNRQTFDAIVLAAPLHSLDIDLSSLNLPPQPHVDYRTIHATFVKGRVNPGYFNWTSGAKLPTHILTVNSNTTEFTSLSVQTTLENGETVTKLFSHVPIEDELLNRLYTKRTWVKRKVWQAYPKLKPLPTTFDDFASLTPEEKQEVTDEQQSRLAWGQVEVVPGVFYVNSFEPLISTMETETLAGKNAARLILNRFLGYCPVPILQK